MSESPKPKKLQRDIQQGRYKKKKLVIGGLTINSRKKELNRQIEIWKKEGWVFQSSDKHCLMAEFLVPKNAPQIDSVKKKWTKKKKFFVWAVTMWFLLGYVLMQMEVEQEKQTELSRTTETQQK